MRVQNLQPASKKAKPPPPEGGARVPVTRGLSAQLLVLTIVLVLVAEVLIYVPSVARDRLVYLEDRIAAADLATLALEEAPNNIVSDALARELLEFAGVRAIVLRGPSTRRLIVADQTPETLAATFDLRQTTPFAGFRDALDALRQRENRVIRVIGATRQDADSFLEVVIDEAPLVAHMIDFSSRLLTLSILISLITAGLVYLALDRRMVRPMRNVTRSMVRFRDRPEDPQSVIGCFAVERLGAVPCQEPAIPATDPLFCFQTLAGVDCYAEEDPFVPEPGLRRAAPPDIGG